MINTDGQPTVANSRGSKVDGLAHTRQSLASALLSIATLEAANDRLKGQVHESNALLAEALRENDELRTRIGELESMVIRGRDSIAELEAILENVAGAVAGFIPAE